MKPLGTPDDLLGARTFKSEGQRIPRIGAKKKDNGG